MKKITKDNIKFIQGIYAGGINLYDIYYFNTNASFSGLRNAVDNINKYNNEVENIFITAGTLKVTVTQTKIDKIKSELSRRYYLEHSYKEVQKFGFYNWFETNKILQVKRPDTYGNSGDYTGIDEKLDTFYSKNKLFVKFSSMKEYQEYYDIDNKEEYNYWFEKNKDFFTIIKI